MFILIWLAHAILIELNWIELELGYFAQIVLVQALKWRRSYLDQ